MEEEREAFPRHRAPELGDPVRALFRGCPRAARRDGGDLQFDVPHVRRDLRSALDG